MKPLSRRDFLNLACQFAVGGSLGSRGLWSFPSKLNSQGQWIYLNGLYWDKKNKNPINRKGPLSVLDNNRLAFLSFFTEAGEHDRVQLPSVPHTVLQSPDSRFPHRVLTIPRRSSVAVEVDLRSRKINRLFDSVPEYVFYGHGVVTPDGQSLIISETHKTTSEGMLTVRDRATLKVLRQIPSYGYFPHDLKYLATNEGELWVCNSGKRRAVEGGDFGQYDGTPHSSNLSRINFKTGKLMQSWDCPTQHTQDDGFQHLLRLPEGAWVLATTPRKEESGGSGNVYLLNVSGNLKLLNLPQELQKRARGQYLSIVFNEVNKEVWVTMPKGGFVVIFSSQTGDYKGHVDCAGVSGLTFSGKKELLFASSYNAQTFVINPKGHQIAEKPELKNWGGTEAHLEKIWMPTLSL
jgi:hypothetical protein